MPQLFSERLLYSKFKAQDAALYALLMKNEKVMKTITGRALTDEECETRFAGVLHINEVYPALGIFAIHNKSDQTFTGLCKLVMTAAAEAEIGYALLPEAWGKGYGSEISLAMVDYARTIDTIATVKGIIEPGNEASKRILQKCGFHFDRVYRINNLPAEDYKLELK